MATKAQKLGNVIFTTCLISLLFNGTAVFGSTMCALKFVPASDCVTADCVNDCNEMNFWAIEMIQFVPSMMHLCWENTCYCSVQSQDIWSEGKGAIASYTTVSEDFGVEIPSDEGQQYTYDSCVDLCMGFGYEKQKYFDEKASGDDVWFHVVAKGNCYCKVKPVFADMPSEAPDELLSFLPEDDEEFYDDDDDDDDDGYDPLEDPSLDDIPVDYIEGSEDDPLVQEEQNRNYKRSRSGKRLPKELEVMPTIEEKPEDDDPEDDQSNKRNKMSPSA